MDDNTPLGLASLLTQIVLTCSPTLDQRYADVLKAKQFISDNSELVSILQQAKKTGTYEEVRKLEKLQAVSHSYVDAVGPIETRGTGRDTIQRSWELPYISGPEFAFIDTLKAYRRNDREDASYYAPYLPIVQSSGTGKSRMVHEASGVICSVVVNLRDPETSGYPPCDLGVRNYFSGGENQSQLEAYNRCYLFCVALFDAVRNLLTCQNGPRSAAELQKYLGYGNPTVSHQRSGFFAGVIHDIDDMEVVEHIEQSANKETPIHQSPPTKIKKSGNIFEHALEVAFDRLQATINNLPTVDSESEADPGAIDFILALDEALLLTPVKTSGGLDWSMFGELRRVLRRLRDRSFYAVFLSTTGSIRQFRPNVRDDTSRRLYTGQLLLRNPYVQTGFDQLAIPVKEGIDLKKVAEPQHFAGQGRPLLSGRYKSNPNIDHVVGFASEKLMNGQSVKHATWKDALLAPLAVRLPLQFNTSTFTGRRFAEEHVEKHMRLCLGVLPDSDIMETINPSEPILAEAAARLMQSFNSATVLHSYLTDTHVSKGDRGELGIMLLFLMAHDSAVKTQPSYGPKLFHRPVPLLQLLDHLFAKKITDARFRKEFKNSWVFFTHFVKVTDKSIITTEFIWRMMIRGAAIQCADYQKAYDMVIPSTVNGQTVSENNTAGIYLQGKNCSDLTNVDVKPTKQAFEKMDPIQMGIFKSKTPRRVINIVLALAATDPSVVVTEQTHSFDIFAGGTSHLTYSPIKEDENGIWQSILARSGVEEIYGENKMVANITMSMCPGVRTNDAHWQSFISLDSD
ncbi:hypothetical protein BD410DRAFT_799567 [Rickenella mellea]|uniref:Uncharacterized protein n=1 Tax=Rickenella mellea TaxID=50990 RepID=A0A4Y7QMJ8_9AGAM|nr:hypothetical protein BD410DRAFT_799567 [Rickenella mellea]